MAVPPCLRALAAVLLLLAVAPTALAGCMANVGDLCNRNATYEACCDGLSCHPVIKKCYHSPRAYLEPCVAGSAAHDCGPGLACNSVFGKCYYNPPREGDPCTETTACDASLGLSCDLTIKRCVKPAGARQTCHAYGQACSQGLECDTLRAECYGSPRQKDEYCTKPGVQCAPGLQCDTTLQTCQPIPQLGQSCTDTNPCPGNLSCAPYIRKCYNSPRLAGQPCQADADCSPGLFCDSGLSVCAALAKKGEQCTSTRPCGPTLSCHAGIQRCYSEPRAQYEPCMTPTGALACGPGLVCDVDSTQTCLKPAQGNERCWSSRPCDTGMVCSPTFSKCLHSPRYQREPCGGVEGGCGTGLVCLGTTKKKCVRISPERSPCYSLPGEELPCLSPFECQPVTQLCYHKPGDGNDICAPGSWPCRSYLSCSADYPYCVDLKKV